MGASGGFPIDLILFGMIAAFLVLRLRSILGRRQGFERPPEPHRPDLRVMPAEGPAVAGHLIDGLAEPVAAATRPLPDPASPLGQTLARMQQTERGFAPSGFLAGAEAAFRLIVTSFADAKREVLRPLLSDDTYRAFDAAISAREATGETQHTELRAINSATVEAAELRGSHASLTVRFVSDQVNLTLGRDGQPVTGTEAVTEIVDIWTFERDLNAPDPTWRLAAARSG
jgi:predicted lipid-binding transport protein (Tim44 family)